MSVPHPAVTAGSVDVKDTLSFWDTQVSDAVIMYPQSINISMSHAFSSLSVLLGYAETPVSAVSPAASMPATAHSSSISEVSPDIPTAPIMD
jgi:predicted dinucleotide-utilizing enzyme